MRSWRVRRCVACATAPAWRRAAPPAAGMVRRRAGAVRISSVSLSGKQVTLTYAEPGIWFGDIALFDGLPRTHDADAHGQTTLLLVRRARLPRAAGAARRAVRRAAAAELPPPAADVRPVRGPEHAPAAGSAGQADPAAGEELRRRSRAPEIRIGLQLAQEDLAQLLGASRQRVNQELKGFERDGAVRVEPTRLVVLSRDKLLRDRRTLNGHHDEHDDGTLRGHQGRQRTARLRHRGAAGLPASSTCPASPARCGRAVQGRPVEPDLQADHARARPT